ncbi:MAG: hypothetical protein U5J83_04905 [Bryobacterales bacterium]|nr:hypothetical protein [Bryobacterales bacterium]
MAEWNRFRWAFLAMAIVGVAGWASAQRVAAYSPAQTTAGYLPASDLAVTITLEQVQVPPALPGYGMRAYWDVQGGTRIPVSGTPGATTAIVSVAPALRTIGQHTVIFCVVFNTGETQIESCTNPATSARFTVNAAPGITNASLLPGASVNTPYSVALTASGGTGARSWSLGQGSALPPGLSLNPTTGRRMFRHPHAGGHFQFHGSRHG